VFLTPECDNRFLSQTAGAHKLSGDRHPDHDHVQLACGFSGHGFKFASVIGQILADRALGAPDSKEEEFLRLRRFFTGTAPSRT
jgi:glycine/D-amino acid oxidase-like deaminating enzyme